MNIQKSYLNWPVLNMNTYFHILKYMLNIFNEFVRYVLSIRVNIDAV